MSRYAFLRVEADSGVVERVLGLTPGVEVVETLDDGRDDAPVGSRVEDESDDRGLVGTVTPDDEVLEEGSALREYGLLGVGISFVMLGIATVGIWWYRRRTSGGSVDAETPPPATEFETPDEPGTPAPSSSVDESSEQAPEEDRPDSLSLDLDEDADEAADEGGDDATDSHVAESSGRRSEREDVEWAPKWSDSPPEPSVEADADEGDEATAEVPDAQRTGASVDAAPLLGIAFIAVTGAIVRWAQGDDEA